MEAAASLKKRIGGNTTYLLQRAYTEVSSASKTAQFLWHLHPRALAPARMLNGIPPLSQLAPARELYTLENCWPWKRRRYGRRRRRLYSARRRRSRRRSQAVFQRPMGCVDFPAAWDDMIGRSCQNYTEEKYCTLSGGYGEGWGQSSCTRGVFSDWVEGGPTADAACCACGGGVVRVEGVMELQVDPVEFLTFPGTLPAIRAVLALQSQGNHTSSEDNLSHIEVAFHDPGNNSNDSILLLRFSVSLKPLGATHATYGLLTATATDTELELQRNLPSNQTLAIIKREAHLATDPIRLVRLAGTVPHRGRLEIYHEHKWGAACGAQLSRAGGQKAWAMLGFSYNKPLLPDSGAC